MARILIADDSYDARYLLRTVLAHAGHEVTEAVDGAEALKLARAAHFDLLISDGLMPVMDGFRLCLELRRDAKLCSLPFIFLTASFTQSDDLQLASAMGADAYLLKPAEPELILSTVEHVLAGPGPSADGMLVNSRLTAILDRYSERIEEKLDAKVADLTAARALRDSYHALLDHLPVLVMTLDSRGTPDFANRTLAAFLGSPETEALLAAVHPADDAAAKQFVASLVADPRPTRAVVRVRNHTDEYHVLEFTARPYDDANGNRLGFVIAGTDITRQEQQRELLLHAAEHDPLTDLPTRHVFDQRLDEILRNVSKGANCALLIVNSADLKAVNDRYGFDVGDATLANLARTISDAVRPGDLVARLCATEFGILAEGLGWEEASDLADTVSAAVASASLVPAAPAQRITVSTIVSVIPEVRPPGASTAPAMLAERSADVRLLAALQDRPELSFSPVYTLADGRIARCSMGYAFAVDERLVSGDELALGAAKHGVARRMTDRIVETALEQVREGGFTCSMALSLAAVLDPTVFERAELAAERLGITPGRLFFEVGLCDLGGIRPPAHWLNAARRSPVRLVHVCTDLSGFTSDPDRLGAATEVELPLYQLLNDDDTPHVMAEQAVERWRAAGAEVTATGVDRASAFGGLIELGVTRASGSALAPVVSRVTEVPHQVRVGG